MAEHRRLQRVYRWYAPVYDRLFARMYLSARARSLASLQLAPNARVLLAAVGTGLDLPFLPAETVAVGIDVNPEMLARARISARPRKTDLIVGDAQAAPFRAGAFDAVVLHLILSVAPDPAAVVSEAARAVRVGGHVVICDVFAPEGGVSLLRRAVNVVMRLLGTDITRSFASMLEGQPLRVLSDRPALGGVYRTILLERV